MYTAWSGPPWFLVSTVARTVRETGCGHLHGTGDRELVDAGLAGYVRVADRPAPVHRGVDVLRCVCIRVNPPVKRPATAQSPPSPRPSGPLAILLTR